MNKTQEICEWIKTGDIEKLTAVFSESPSLVKERTEQGISFLQLAAYYRNEAVIDVLKQYNRDLDIFEASCMGETGTVVSHIRKEPALIHAFSPDGFTALGLASYFGKSDIVTFLLEEGANPNLASTNQFKVTPLHSACAISHYDIALMLIKHGADVNVKQMQGVTPLHSAAHNCNTDITRLLIDNGADINSKMENGQTPLSMALEKGFLATADLIRKHGGY